MTPAACLNEERRRCSAPFSSYAYPTKILNFHEIINETLDGVPLLVTYCPLCRSGIVYDRTLDGREMTFGNTSALFDNDMVMHDHQTNNYWWHVAGRAIVGELSGTGLEALVVNDELAGVPLAVFSQAEGPTGAVFDRRLDGDELTFRLEDGEIVDARTGSRWGRRTTP